MLKWLLLPILFAPGYLLGTCGPAPASYAYRFLNPRVVSYDSELAPFFLHFGEVYRDQLEQPAGLQRRENIAEWQERFCDVADATEIEAIIYGDNLALLERLADLLRQASPKVADLPLPLQSNAFARHLLEANCEEVVAYLLFAKRCEPHVVARSDAFARGTQDRPAMEQLLETGLADFPKVESHYVRLRYAYQLIRLAHYLKEYAYVGELYAYLMPKIDADPSLVYDWVEGHRAGALQSLGDYAQSAYLYSRIFERSASKRESAYLSFSIQTDAQWKEALLLCQNDHERATLHVLRAHNGRAVVLEEMRAIYDYEPRNTALELLTMRELQELEAELLGANIRPAGYPGDPRARERLIDLQGFVNQVIKDEKVAPDFWLLARGVLEMLAGDYFLPRRPLPSWGGPRTTTRSSSNWSSLRT